ADRNRSHWSTSKTPSYTKSVSWQHHQVFAGNYRSDYLWYAILGGTNSRAKAELNGAFFNITRPRNIAFNYIVRAA
ncbi:hypothetical protein ACAG05_24415, partial [Escherichia coli]